jgi:chorismate dehydratase
MSSSDPTGTVKASGKTFAVTTSVEGVLPSKPVQLSMGWIPYLNLRPHRLVMQEQFKDLFAKVVTEGHPTEVNRWLAEGSIETAPSSSINLFQNAHLRMAAPVGVASTGPVQSVYFGAGQEHKSFVALFWERLEAVGKVLRDDRAMHVTAPRETAKKLWSLSKKFDFPIPLPPINWTSRSAASVGLGKILLDVLFPNRDQVASSLPPLELIIGDEALVRRPEFDQIIDLGEAWNALTGLPFVFAIWQTSKANPAIEDMLIQTSREAESLMHSEPERFYPAMPPLDIQGHPLDLEAYWQCIQYELTSQHLCGMDLYFSLLQRHQLNWC